MGNTMDWPIAITTVTNDISAGVCLWEHQRRRLATIAVKATFLLVPGGVMTLCAPSPIERVERSLAQGLEPGDLAPCLASPEIWVRGHAWYPPADGAPSVRVRVAVARVNELLMRKSVEIPVSRHRFVPPYMHAFGPLSRKWPVRTRLLGVFDWTDLEREPMLVPDVFDWAYFQAAPEDQRLPQLQGNEGIRLEAMHSTILQFDTLLPSATCEVKLFGKVEPLVHGAAVPMGMDTIQIDVDRGTCALVFRGRVDLPTDIRLEDLEFVAGLGLPGRSVPKLEPRHRFGGTSCDVPVMQEDAGSTSFVDMSKLSNLLEGSSPLPFQAGMSDLATTSSASLSREARDDAGQTCALDVRLLEMLVQEKPLPFHAHASSSSRVARQNIEMGKPAQIEDIGYVEPTPIAQVTQINGLPLTKGEGWDHADAGSTCFLSEEMLAEVAAQVATPFVGGEEQPEREEAVDIWAGLPFQPAGGEEQATGSLGAIFLRVMGQMPMDQDFEVTNAR